MTTKQLKQLYFDFFQERGHALISSASLVPENDPSVLFTTAGMHPLVPYLMGEKHPQGPRLVNVQKCLRTTDIEEVGDDTHLTFLEMLGNWSLGNYFKQESIDWSYEFLTDQKFLGLDPGRLHVSVFAGEEGIPRDDESARQWEAVGIPHERIYYLPRKDNFWGPVGDTGPCGPDTEIFYDTGKDPCGVTCRPGCNCGKYFEIWNNVFMEFEKTSGGRYIPLKQKNVDTGMGVERTAAVLKEAGSVYEIDTIEPLVETVRRQARKLGDNVASLRIVVDHIRSVVFLLADERNVRPSNIDQGYVLRRLIRRMIRHARMIEFNLDHLPDLVQIVIREYHRDYPELVRNRDAVKDELGKEKDKFLKTLEQGMKMFDKFSKEGALAGSDAFVLFSTYGFPIEMVEELARERNIKLDTREFESRFREHQGKSRTATAGKFKGGLADHSEQTIKYHTANHILLEAMKRVLGRDTVNQKGSNITSLRLRFDFTFPRKLTEDEIRQIEDLANAEIEKHHAVHCEELPLAEARRRGATGVFDHKYGDTVKVYFVGDFSKEICGGPHVTTTKSMGRLRIVKEEASSAGVRRIRAILE